MPDSSRRLPTAGCQVTVPGQGELPLARVLKEHYLDLTWGEVRRLCATGRVSVDGEVVTDSRRSVHAGSQVVVTGEGGPRVAAAPAGPPPVTIRFEDRHIIVVEKPAGISSVPFDENEKGTLLDLIRTQWQSRTDIDPRTPLLVVQRLDKETSGVMVIAKSELAQTHLGHQLRRRGITRLYLAIVAGEVKDEEQTFESFLGRPREGAKLRSVEGGAKGPGKEAITHVKVLQRLKNATLVSCKLETGRTHQIRIHLSEAGYPLLGEKVYLRGQAPSTGAPRLMLHAVQLGFRHPVTGRTMGFESRLPTDFVRVLTQLGGYSPDGFKKAEEAPLHPEWTRRDAGGKKVRNFKDLLDRVGEEADWKEGSDTLPVRRSAPPRRDDRPRPERPRRFDTDTPRRDDGPRPEQPRRDDGPRPERPRRFDTDTPRRDDGPRPERPRRFDTDTPRRDDGPRPERPRREGSRDPGNFGFPATEGIGERPKVIRPEEGGKLRLRRRGETTSTEVPQRKPLRRLKKVSKPEPDDQD